MRRVTPDTVLQYFRDVVAPEILARQVKDSSGGQMIAGLVEEVALRTPKDKIYRVSVESMYNPKLIAYVQYYVSNLKSMFSCCATVTNHF